MTFDKVYKNRNDFHNILTDCNLQNFRGDVSRGMNEICVGQILSTSPQSVEIEDEYEGTTHKIAIKQIKSIELSQPRPNLKIAYIELKR